MSLSRYPRSAIAVLYRRAGLIALCTLAGGAASLPWTWNEPRVYAATAKVALRTSPQSDPRDGSMDAASDTAEAEIASLRARGNAQAVVDRYAIREDQLVRGDDAWPRLEAAVTRDSRARTVDMFLDDLSVTRAHAANGEPAPDALELKFECADPGLAPLALRALLDRYLQLGVQRDRRVAETRAALLGTLLAQASDDVRRREDDVVAVLVRHGRRTPASGLKLDLDIDPRAGGRYGGATPSTAALDERASALPSYLDEARAMPAQDTGDVLDARLELAAPGQRLDAPARAQAAFEADLDRLDGERRHAQQRLASLQGKVDHIDLFLRQAPTQDESRVVLEAPDRLAVSEVGNRRSTGLLAATAGFLLGVLLAWRRDTRGGRMRSSREAERALGVPVLGAIPTLSAKAREAYLATSWGEPSPAQALAA